MKYQYFILYQDCVITDGISKSIIFDFGQKNYISIEKSQRNQFIHNRYFHCNENNITFALNLKKINYGYFSNTVSNDELITRNYNYFNAKDFSNIVLNLGENIKYDIELFISKIKHLNVDSIQIRCNDTCELILFKLLSFIENFSIRSIELFYPYVNSNSTKTITRKILKVTKKITFISFYNSPKNERYIFHRIRIIHNTQNIFDDNQCGYISQSYFVPDIQFYSEAQFHNSCLNKKIAIDLEGNIKNCPYSKELYGNISSIDLNEMLLNEHYKKYWFLKKDNIKICSDCEFRYICSDCRVFTINGELNQKPEKCKYDPYTNTWED
jgi:SPASM domain peptide maturase of grasp-with-spasm system